MLLTGATPRYLRADVSGAAGDSSSASDQALWWPPSKIVGYWLAPYLALGNEELEAPAGVAVDADLTAIKWRAMIGRDRDGRGTLAPAGRPPSSGPTGRRARAQRTPSSALLLYAYAKGNPSSRGIERECREDVAYRVVCANHVPDHSMVAEFRVRHEAALAEVFTSVLSLCRRAGLVSVGIVAADGTKIAANV